MRCAWIIAVAVLMIVTVVRGDELPPASGQPSVELKTAQEKASYGFGYQVGRQFRGQGIAISVEAFLGGLRDALAGRKSAVKEQELFNAMAQHQQASMTQLASANKEKGIAFLTENGKKKDVVTLENGLQYLVLKQGNGPTPKESDRVKTHYQGKLLDGTVFDSTLDLEPATFGLDEVIPGWKFALTRMKVGDKWRIFVPAELAYGVQGAAPDIGPNSVLTFEIELLGIEPPNP